MHPAAADVSAGVPGPGALTLEQPALRRLRGIAHGDVSDKTFSALDDTLVLGSSAV